MKHYLLFSLSVILTLAACGQQPGSNAPVAATPTPQTAISQPTTSPLPSSSPQPASTPLSEASLVGNWIEGTNTLSFAANGIVFSNKMKLSYRIEGSEVYFTDEDVAVDSCSFSIVSSGTLTTPIQILLDLVCNRSGSLIYTQSDG